VAVDWKRWIEWAVLLLFAAVTGAAALVYQERRRRLLAPIAAGAVVGGVPTLWVVLACTMLPGMAFFIGLGVACAVGAGLGTVGAWTARLRSATCQRPALALLGTLLGAIVGSVLCVLLGLEAVRVDGDGLFLAALGAGMVGACATLGFQLGAGGPAPPA
jgi:uncharacterized membrane protein